MNKSNYYVAGFFDGEGGCDGTRITITNTDLDMLKKISKWLSNIGIENKIKLRKKYQKHHKDAYDIRVYGRNNIERFYTYIPFQSNEKRHVMLDMIVRTKSVITKEEFRKIKKDNLLGVSLRGLAKKYNYPRTTIHNYLSKRCIPNA